jgi:hypothetical protein
MRLKKLVLVTIPMLSLALASLGGASTKTIYAYLSAPQDASGSFVFDCNHVHNGVYGQVEARARGAYANGTLVSVPSEDYPNSPDMTTTYAGTSYQNQFQDQSYPGTVQHAARIQSLLFDSRDGFYAEYVLSTGPITGGYTSSGGCWNSDLNHGTCVGATPATTISTSTPTNHTCTNRQFTGYSIGATP